MTMCIQPPTPKNEHRDIIIDIVSRLLNDIKDIEIVYWGLGRYNSHIEITLRTTDWNHSFMLNFYESEVVIYHNDGMDMDKVAYSLSDGTLYNMLPTLICGEFKRHIIIQRSDYKTNLISHDEVYNTLILDIGTIDASDVNDGINYIVDFMTQEKMNIVNYKKKYRASDYNTSLIISRVDICMLSEDWNVGWTITINRECNTGKYYGRVVENRLGDKFYSLETFPLQNFSKHVPKFIMYGKLHIPNPPSVGAEKDHLFDWLKKIPS